MMRLALLIGLACAGASLAGCSSGSASGDDHPDGGANAGGGTGSGGANGGPPGSSVAFDGTRITASILVPDVAPGGEQHVCVVVELPIQDRTFIDEVHATLTDGTHHLIVDRKAPGTPLEPNPTACSPTMASDDTRLMIAQQKDTRFTVPAGAAFSLEPHQPLFLQLHYANTSTQARDVEGQVELTVAPNGGAGLVEAHSMFTGSFSITLSPHSPGTVQSFVVPEASSGIRHVFGLTSHTHRLGIRSTIERVPSATAPDTTPLHVSTNWAEPPLTTFSPALAFDGSDGLRLRCQYDNTTDRTVTFGTAVSDEMCFMWVYYFDQ